MSNDSIDLHLLNFLLLFENKGDSASIIYTDSVTEFKCSVSYTLEKKIPLAFKKEKPSVNLTFFNAK